MCKHTHTHYSLVWPTYHWWLAANEWMLVGISSVPATEFFPNIHTNLRIIFQCLINHLFIHRILPLLKKQWNFISLKWFFCSSFLLLPPLEASFYIPWVLSLISKSFGKRLIYCSARHICGVPRIVIRSSLAASLNESN